MSGIDKICGTLDQYDELKAFLVKRNRCALKHMYPRANDDKTCVIANFPRKVDMWLYKYCKIEFVQSRLNEQYNTEELND